MEKTSISDWFVSLQNDICQQITLADGKGKFISDIWERPEGGGGDTRIFHGGAVIEKGGVNFSSVWGKAPDMLLRMMNIKNTGDLEFFASGVSIVLHPHSPMVPIIHMNVRYFELGPTTWWFGGGIDLTPHYVDEGDARHFHRELKAVCDKHHASYYPAFKKWADDYFYIKHRKETRGVGGIFFDHLRTDGGFNKEERFSFVQDVGRAFAPLYVHLMDKNKNAPYTEKEKEWQYLRRGRYVEFNLILDRGTKFGLESNGRTESILMSLPPQARWEYNYHPARGTKEALTLESLKKGIDWAGHPPSTNPG